MKYVVAVYELDRQYGGPEEGGWWFNCGSLDRIIGVYKTEEQAYRVSNRVNQALSYKRFSTGQPSPGLSSVAYAGGYFQAQVFSHTAPAHFPEQRPHFE